MKTRSVVVVILVLAAIGTSNDLLACGDKFLVVGRGTRFQHAAARRAASVLLYANPSSNLPKALANLPVEATLRKAGYRPTTVTTAEALESALREGGWDLILVDVSESQDIRSRVQGDRAPLVLGVMYNPTSAELKQARKRHEAVLKSPTKAEALLDAIDESLSLRPRSYPETPGN